MDETESVNKTNTYFADMFVRKKGGGSTPCLRLKLYKRKNEEEYSELKYMYFGRIFFSFFLLKIVRFRPF